MNFRHLFIVWMLSILVFGIAASYADIKIGSYVWMHRWYDGWYQELPEANRYGGGYNHLDLSWTWTIENGNERVSNDWAQAANCLDDNPANFAGHSGMQYGNYIVKKNYPDVWARIKAHSDAGRWDGSEMNWCEGYFDFGGDEYVMRNYFISTRFCQDNFGYLPTLAAAYDLDAPPWTQPKMMSYMIGRSEENPTGLGFVNRNTWDFGGMFQPYGQFKWTSDDGSVVIVGSGGGWEGDGGGSETCVNSAGRFPTFAEKVLEENVWNTSITETWNDNLISAGSGYSLFWWGAKMCENRLLEAEKFGAFARPYGYTYSLHGDKYLYEVWGDFLKFNQHDIADAQGTPWEVGVSNSRINLQDAYTSALKVADTSLTSALSAISSNINTSGQGTSVIVYNALSWARTDYVIVNTADIGFSSPISVQDDAGAEIPAQVITDGGETKLVFTAENVPSLGFKEYKIFNTAPASSASGVTAANGTEITLENEFCAIKVSKTSGAMTSVFDKINQKELLSGPGNRIASTTSSPNWWTDCCQFYNHFPNDMPASLTYISPTAVSLVDSGPAVARIKATYNENGVNWDHYIMLFNKVPIAANRMVTTNFNNNNELVVNIPLNDAVSNSAKEWNAGVAFGHHKYVDKARYTPTHKWANVANGAKDYSVALLENNCTIWSFYGVGGAHDLRLVLLAEQTSRWGGHWSKTDWEMSWGIWGHPGDWTDGAVQKGYEFNSPLIARVEASHAGELPKQYSFLTVEQENIVVTAVKKWESEDPARGDSLTMQVRFYETDGVNTDAALKFGMQSINAWESMGNEYGVYGNALSTATDNGMQKVTLSTGHNQIRSLKVQMPHDGSPVLSRFIGKNSFQAQKSPAIVRVCNLRGQLIWQGHETDLRNNMPGIRTSKGLYVMQHLAKDGKAIATKKNVRLSGLSGRY